MVSVVQVNTEKLLNRFIEFPHQLYRGDHHYVPQLNLMQRQLLLARHNPFFKTAEALYFLALDDKNRVAGRIAAICNRAHTELYQDDTGFFGCFDCIRDKAVAGSLLAAAAGWLHDKGLKFMIGPESLSTNDTVGILTKGFDKAPVFLMPYNYPYYQELLEQNGLTAVMTLYSYLFKDDDLPKELSAKSPLLENRLKERGIVIRPVNLENFGQEITRLHPVYNEANTGNWGFLPLDETSFFHMAKDLKKLVKAEHVWIAEKESKIIGYAVAVPDYNQVFRKIPRGRLFPFGWYNLLTGQPQIKGIRIMILGVLPAYRGLGIDWCLYAKIAAYALKTKMKWGEACYVMEQNVPMNRMLKTLGAEIVKEYKLYETETKRQTI